MNGIASDLLLSYDPSFNGLTSNSMAHNIELESVAIGGSLSDEDPDNYFNDFTASLDNFIRKYPRVGGGQHTSRTLDWKKMVLSFDQRKSAHERHKRHERHDVAAHDETYESRHAFGGTIISKWGSGHDGHAEGTHDSDSSDSSASDSSDSDSSDSDSSDSSASDRDRDSAEYDSAEYDSAEYDSADSEAPSGADKANEAAHSAASIKSFIISVDNIPKHQGERTSSELNHSSIIAFVARK